MTDAIEFGPEIKRGSPLWPEGATSPVWTHASGGEKYHPALLRSNAGEWRRASWYGFNWTDYDAIRVKSDHPASIAQRWNDDNPGEKPWTVPHFGSEESPSDWDGGNVLYANGCICDVERGGEPFWGDNYGDHSVIAYRSKPSEQTVEDDGYVRIAVMSEADVKKTALGFNASYEAGALNLARRLGIIRPETPVERFKRENPGLSADELLEKALGR